ncbi:MAG TPA: PAS domain-containing protein, partial [Candidatus Dormibacteraeota bacterium]|nr:PAS domain-containing protein [Candidatus Dormibacteraeota bacterium]
MAPQYHDQHELIDLAFDAMFTRSFGKRVITSWNDGAERLYGWTRKEAVGKNAADLLCSRYPIPLEQIEQELRETGRWEGQIVQCRKDGSEVTVEGRWGLQIDAWGQPLAILEINTDLTQHRLMLDRFLQSEERLRLLVTATVDYAIFTLDLDGMVVSWNDGAQRIKGYTADEIIG